MSRTILVVTLCALLSPVAALAGIQYYVRLDGGDDGICDGLVNGPDPGTGTTPRACAFQSPAYAVTRISPGDDIQIAAGTYLHFEITAPLEAGDSDPTVIAGDPAVGRTEIIINGAGRKRSTPWAVRRRPGT